MKELITDYFGKCEMPENFTELIELINQDDIKELHEPYLPTRIWRGQANIDWQVNSSAYRRIENENRNWKELEGGSEDDLYLVSEHQLIEYEKKLLNQATHKGFRTNGSERLSDFELLSKLQHHGAATRLLDFSRNALVALWFCVSDLKEATGCLIGVNYDLLSGYESRRIEDNYDKIIKSMDDNAIVYEPPQITGRISAQNAQFLFSKVVNRTYGSIDLIGAIFIAISPELKRKAHHILKSSFGFDTNYIFPDIEGFGVSNSINESTRNMSRSNLIYRRDDKKS